MTGDAFDDLLADRIFAILDHSPHYPFTIGAPFVPVWLIVTDGVLLFVFGAGMVVTRYAQLYGHPPPLEKANEDIHSYLASFEELTVDGDTIRLVNPSAEVLAKPAPPMPSSAANHAPEQGKSGLTMDELRERFRKLLEIPKGKHFFLAPLCHAYVGFSSTKAAAGR